MERHLGTYFEVRALYTIRQTGRPLGVGPLEGESLEEVEGESLEEVEGEPLEEEVEAERLEVEAERLEVEAERLEVEGPLNLEVEVEP